LRADLGEAARPTAVKAIDEGPRSPPVPVVDERSVPATVAATVSTVARLQVLVKSARGLSKLIPEQKAVGVTLWKSASGRPKKLRNYGSRHGGGCVLIRAKGERLSKQLLVSVDRWGSP